MRVLIATSEAVPFAKTGGLADVAGAIPKELRSAGHDVRVIMPLYRSARARAKESLRRLSPLRVDIGGQPVDGQLFEGDGPQGVPFYFIECDRYYDRDQLYGTSEGDFSDNAERFVFFARGAVEAIQALSTSFQLVHVHDWQASLIPVYLRTIYAERTWARDLPTLLTIHNLAFQGIFWHWDMKLTGFDWSLFTPERLEFYGKLNFLKGGVIFADAINTVSRTYAREIQTVEFGSGLEGVLRNRSQDLFGILNGVDYDDWDPARDPLIPARYTPEDLSGKAACKEALQRELGLTADAQLPLLGMVARLDDQKGLDILASAMDEIMALDLELVVLGTGHERYQRLLAELAEQYKGKLGVKLQYDNRLAHLIEAGADMYLMPSRYEPCGLNQLYALKYGTVPIVRATGGLADTIQDASRGNGETANGFSFQEYSGPVLAATVARAVAMFGDKRRWKKLMTTGMMQDWSWARAGREYESLYQRIIDRRKTPIA